jgi:hypothetical protein
VEVKKKDKYMKVLKKELINYLQTLSLFRIRGLTCRALATCYHAGFLFGLFFGPDDGGGLHGIISKRVELFISIFVLARIA